MSTIAVYKRVSTSDQDTAAQWHTVEAWLTTRGIADYVVYEDVASGKRADRVNYQRLLSDVRAGRIDTVVVYALDRISRDATAAMQVLLDWMQRGVSFYPVSQPMLQLGADNPLRHVIAALFATLADMERQAIVSRTKSGLAAARARGTRLGAMPKLTAAQVAQAMAARQQGARIDHLAAKYKVSTATMSRALRRGGNNDVHEAAATDPG